MRTGESMVKIYHGYGHTENMVVYGHVLRNKRASTAVYKNIFTNIINMLRLFMVQPLAFEKVQLNWAGQLIETQTADDGFFKLEWSSATHVPAGLHEVTIRHVKADGNIVSTGTGHVYVPHVTQFAFISDIDDTVLVSYSATILKRLRELLFKGPEQRRAFDDVAVHYKQLSLAHTEPGTPNPFFYVSSSEWNLYDHLVHFFRVKKLPEGAFLLSQLKRLHQLIFTGKTKHEGKLVRIIRIMEAFPLQQFVLLGDSSQQDIFIYEKIITHYPGKIHAVYIRDVRNSKTAAVLRIMETLQAKGIKTCFFKSSRAAIAHSKKIGLIE